ncbi:NAD(P)-dependent oxidoreductase [Synergistaceae bacterium OttesenSCG-928-I11]|nr:NAD(P)-dependent oxidoreductase [Synergistaceae bacterium OttesenSCG-928-I11]
MKKVVLTGATGFLGYVLLRELVANGVFVYAVCRKNSQRLSRLDNIDNIAIIELNMDEILDLSKYIDEPCDVFYHLAWEGERDNFEQQYKNVGVAVDSVKVASVLGCAKYICTGSQAEYCFTEELIDEDTPLHPATSYGACKVAAYFLTKDAAEKLGLSHIWVRVFSVYGPHDNPNTLIMQLLDNARKNKITHLETDASHVWNYLHEDDAARALYLIGEKDLGASGVYNLAGDSNQFLSFYLNVMKDIAPSKINFTFGTTRSAVNLCVSIDKISRAINWKPKEYYKNCVSGMLSQINT